MELHDEDWELINDDGFVYKRLKRLRVDPTVSTSVTPPPDPAVEERNRKERKKTILLKLKTRYQQEIHQWEHLSNTLKALQERTQTQPLLTALPDPYVSQSTHHSTNSTYHELAQTLLIQVSNRIFNFQFVCVCNPKQCPLLTQNYHQYHCQFSKKEGVFHFSQGIESGNPY